MTWSDVISPDSIPKGSLQSKSEGGEEVEEKNEKEEKKMFS